MFSTVWIQRMKVMVVGDVKGRDVHSTRTDGVEPVIR